MPKKANASGYWNVTLNHSFSILGYAYLPGVEHQVDEATLALLQEEDGLIAECAEVAGNQVSDGAST